MDRLFVFLSLNIYISPHLEYLHLAHLEYLHLAPLTICDLLVVIMVLNGVLKICHHCLFGNLH